MVDNGSMIVSAVDTADGHLKFLLIKSNGMLELSGGGIKPEESTLEAATRRLDAECGLSLNGVSISKLPTLYQKNEAVFDTFLASFNHLPDVRVKSSEISDYGFYEVNEILSMRAMVSDSEDKIRYAAFTAILRCLGAVECLELSSKPMLLSNPIKFGGFKYFNRGFENVLFG